jgi:hypothetical protein
MITWNPVWMSERVLNNNTATNVVLNYPMSCPVDYNYYTKAADTARIILQRAVKRR